MKLSIERLAVLGSALLCIACVALWGMSYLKGMIYKQSGELVYRGGNSAFAFDLSHVYAGRGYVEIYWMPRDYLRSIGYAPGKVAGRFGWSDGPGYPTVIPQ